ncbi:hypothetical protein [Halodesulfurarchaeum sp.]|uniref:hypothetical protein n=1 Tax=Halodesulfurarchaeum sp. TaxID=1980530 RepID=UPI002FC30BBA
MIVSSNYVCLFRHVREYIRQRESQEIAADVWFNHDLKDAIFYQFDTDGKVLDGLGNASRTPPDARYGGKETVGDDSYTILKNTSPETGLITKNLKNNIYHNRCSCIPQLFWHHEKDIESRENRAQYGKYERWKDRENGLSKLASRSR